MDKGIYTVDPVQQKWMVQKPLLERHLPKNPEALLQMDHLESMLSSDVDSTLDDGDSGESST